VAAAGQRYGRKFEYLGKIAMHAFALQVMPLVRLHRRRKQEKR